MGWDNLFLSPWMLTVWYFLSKNVTLRIGNALEVILLMFLFGVLTCECGCDHFSERLFRFEPIRSVISSRLEPPDPWILSRDCTHDGLKTAYQSVCDIQGVKPFSRIIDQIQRWGVAIFSLVRLFDSFVRFELRKVTLYKALSVRLSVPKANSTKFK